MKRFTISAAFTILFACSTFAQVPNGAKDLTGKFYTSWGWNRESFTKSDIHMEGDGYNIDFQDVKAKDRQSSFSLKTYLFLTRFSTPQTNLKLGYYLSNKFSIALGFDHMKYVMVQDQTVIVNGDIDVGNSKYNGTYNNREMVLTKDFLAFEHTNGLNYVFAEINRHVNVYARPKFQLTGVFGASPAFLRPRTDVSFLGVNGPNVFHFAGYGINGKAGINALFWNRFYLMSEVKGGYINMPNIRATSNGNERVSQHFGFMQANIMMGFLFGFK